jgi:ribosome biogenesis GTPase
MSELYISLMPWGWSPEWRAAFTAAAAACPRGVEPVPARVVGREGPTLELETSVGPRLGLVSGRLRYQGTEDDLPLVGDWVACQPIDADQAVVHAVVVRKTKLARAFSEKSKSAATQESLLAANLDVLVIVTGLDGNFNPRRAQRLATLARHGGIVPLWVLTKADLPGSEDKIAQAARAAGADPVIALSSLTGQGLDQLEPWLHPGTTLALVGSSGVGKTTLTNRLLGTHLETREVRGTDSKGRHTTTSRHLYRLPGGGLLMDTPGMRTVGLWADSEDLSAGFSDIEALARDCRFPDCRHQSEPGCAVRRALDDGTLDEARWEGWRRQEREVRFLESRADKGLQRVQKDRWKAINKGMRDFTKEGRSRGAAG